MSQIVGERQTIGLNLPYRTTGANRGQAGTSAHEHTARESILRSQDER
jgi:hypothetical protein